MRSLQRFFMVMLPLGNIVPDPNPEPAPSPVPAPAGGALICEFCDSRLARNGQVLEVGKRAKKLRDSEDVIETHLGTIRERDATITDLNRQIAELQARLPKQASGSSSGW